MDNVRIAVKGNSLQAKQGSVKVKCDRCTCSMEANNEEVQLDGLNFCKRCLDCIDD